jgi:copper resistance protein D
VGGAATRVTRSRAVALGALCVVATAAAAWSLAYPQNSLGATLIRALTDCAAVVALGLVVVPMFDAPRHRDELANRAAGPLILVSATWAVAELARLFAGAAEAAGTSAVRVGLNITVQFATDTAAGRSNLVCLAAAALVCVIAATAPRTSASAVVAAGAAAIGMAGRSLVGHLSASPLGGVAVAVHTLAAAVWCGALAALILTVSHRGQWARVLPRFSQLSMVCVVVLLVCGVAGAVVTLGSPADLFATGYGRVLTAKIVVTAVLLGLAWRNRVGWLPAAQAHRASASTSHSRSRTELAIMAVALTFAAALAVTG